MSNLLREYIELMLEAMPVGQSSLMASKILGYAAEWATWEACSGKDGFKFATQEDKNRHERAEMQRRIEGFGGRLRVVVVPVEQPRNYF